MIIAAVRDTPYNILLLLHIITVIVAFVPAIAHPVMTAQAKNLEPQARGQVHGFIARNSMRIYGNALILTGLLGFGLSGMSEDVYPLSATWILASIVLWVLMIGALHGLIVPAERKMAAGDESAKQLVDIGGVVLTVLGLVVLYLMIFKPGA